MKKDHLPTWPAMGRKLKMPPPLLFTSTTVRGGRDSLQRLGQEERRSGRKPAGVTWCVGRELRPRVSK